MNKILITLDSILDTRISTLLEYTNYKIDSEYFNRITDNFKGIGASNFRYLMSKRNRDILIKSKRTKAYLLLPSIIAEMKVKLSREQNNNPVEIYIDFYPYELADRERELIKSSLQRIVTNGVIIKEAFNDDWKDYSIIIDYYGIEKLDKLIYKNLRYPEKSLIVPQIVDNELYYNDNYSKGLNAIYRDYIDLVIVDSVMFNMDIDDNEV